MRFIKPKPILALIFMAFAISLAAPSFAHESQLELDRDIRGWLLKNPEILLEMSAVILLERGLDRAEIRQTRAKEFTHEIQQWDANNQALNDAKNQETIQ